MSLLINIYRTFEKQKENLTRAVPENKVGVLPVSVSKATTDIVNERQIFAEDAFTMVKLHV